MPRGIVKGSKSFKPEEIKVVQYILEEYMIDGQYKDHSDFIALYKRLNKVNDIEADNVTD